MSRARISWIGGPVLRARMEGPFSIYESLAVGPRKLLGEVIQLRGDELVAQVYEDTTGLRPGQEVVGDGLPLTIRLGPGLLGHIFDGLLRPLAGLESPFVAAGLRQAAAREFGFTPGVRVGDTLAAGQVFGTVRDAERNEHDEHDDADGRDRPDGAPLVAKVEEDAGQDADEHDHEEHEPRAAGPVGEREVAGLQHLFQIAS